MTIPTLPTDLAEFVIEQVGSGKYASEAEVVFDGLRILRERERQTALLREQIAPALARLERGEGRQLEAEDVIRRGAERHRSKGAAA
jgi:antitoxin ParD1/3/4